MNTVEGKQCIMISGWIQIKFHTKLGTLQLNKKFISLVTMQEQDQPHDLHLYYRPSFSEQKVTLRSPINSCLLWTKCIIHFIAGNEHWGMFRFGLFFKLVLLLYVPWAGSCFMLHLSQLTKMTAVPCGAVLQPQSFEAGDGSHGCPLVCSTADHVSTCTEGKEGKHPQTSKTHTIKSIVGQSFKTSNPLMCRLTAIFSRGQVIS